MVLIGIIYKKVMSNALYISIIHETTPARAYWTSTIGQAHSTRHLRSSSEEDTQGSSFMKIVSLVGDASEHIGK